MKKYLVILIFLSAGAAQKSFSQTTDSTLNALLAIDETQYIGKPLDSIIVMLPAGYNQIKVKHGGHRYTAEYIRFRYSNKVYIELHVREFNFMNPVDTNQVWDITLMRKEKLYKTVIYKHVNCYRNCDVY